MAEKLWVEQYMRETERGKRGEILKAAIAEEGLLPDNELRRKLLEARYEKEGEREIDAFIRGWMNLLYLDSSSQSLFAKKRIAKEKERIFADWQLAEAKTYGEAGTEVLCQEFFNTARLYIDLCKEDSTYRSVLLGLGRIKEDKFIAKLARDFYRVGYSIPARFGIREELRPFTKGITNAFCEVFDRQKEYLLSLIAENQQEK